eukprot:Hpha_TRINITY_DN15871_c1_g3::TRINITY_DN15871_c1_g3_i1::g.187768::m.187768
MRGMISIAVDTPWSFCPPRSSFSMSDHFRLGSRANASAHLRLRPPTEVVMRSATPQLSNMVSRSDVGKKCRTKRDISSSPVRITAAFALLPNISPSQNPAPRATTFFSPPQSSVPATSEITVTLKLGRWNTLFSSFPYRSVSRTARVHSQKSPFATSFATLAPISTPTSTPRVSLITSEPSTGRLKDPFDTSTWPLIRDTATAPGLMASLQEARTLGSTWCGMFTTIMSASLTHSAASAVATMFSGSLYPGRYFTFSCAVLMISVSLRPRTISSYTYIKAFSSKLSRWSRMFHPTIRAIAHPQLPLPRSATRSFFCSPIFPLRPLVSLHGW